MTKLNSVRRMVALPLAMLVAVITLACSCQLGNLTKLATEVAPTKALVVQTAAPKPTRAPASTQTPTPVPTSVLVTGKMTLHTNEEAGLHIQYPADWFVESEADGSYFAKAESGLDTMDPTDGPVFGVFVGPLADIETGVGTVESVEQLMDALLGEGGFIPEGGEIGEYEALRPDVLVVPAHWVDKDTEQLWHVLLGVTISGERAGVMAGVTTAEEWESYLDVFRTMAGSVELFEPTATPQVVPTKEVMKFTAREVPGTATDLSGDLEFSSYRGWIDEEGDFQIAAEVANVGDRTYDTYIDVYWRLLDANGDVLLEDNSFLDRPILAPGEKSSFWSFSWGGDLKTGTVDDVASFELWLKLSDLKRSEVMIEVTAHKGGPTKDEFSVGGTVRNNLDSAVSDIYVYATLYDASGNVVTILYGWPDSDQLAPGEESAFTLWAWNDWKNAVSYGNVFATGSLVE